METPEGTFEFCADIVHVHGSVTAEVVKNAVDTALEKFGPIASGIFAACVDEGSQMVKSMGEVVFGDGPNVAAIRHISTIQVV